MATLRKHRNKWQSIIRVQGHPTLCKSFVSRTDAKRWATEAERPKKAEPRDRRFNDNELNLLIRGNYTTPELRSIIKIALETGIPNATLNHNKPRTTIPKSFFIA